MSIVISPKELNDAISQGQALTVLAASWDTEEAGSFNQFSSLHIPTARWCDVSAALAGTPGTRAGRNPLPDTRALQEWFVRWGLRAHRPVVVYDEGRGLLAGRAWWILRWAGVQDVRILDGGLAAWRRHGFATLTGPGNLSVESNVTVQPNSVPAVTIEEVKAHKGLIIDTREPNRFAGYTENLDLMAGHMPGAVNVPELEVFNPDNTFKSPEEIRAVFADKGVDPSQLADAIITSGSGNHSALVMAAMAHAGLDLPRHYVAGWSQWAANPANPVERGE